MVSNRIIELSDNEIETKRRQLMHYQYVALKNKAAIRLYEKYLDTGFHKLKFEQGIKDFEEMVKNGKDVEGKEIPELDLMDLKIQLECRKAELADDLPTAELRKELFTAKEEVKNAEANVKVLEKHIRERKISVQQNG